MQHEKPQIVWVAWYDSLMLDHGEWMDLSDVDEAMTAPSLIHYSVGYLVKETALAICIAPNTSPEYDRCSGATVIPKSAIVRRIDGKRSR